MSNPVKLKLSSVNRPYPGEQGSGDLPFHYAKRDELVLGLVDSLGHGERAHASSMLIKGFLDAHWGSELTQLLDQLHARMRGGIGAAICLAHVALGSGALRCVGIGNVNAWILGSGDQRFVNRDGVLGQYYRTPVAQEARLKPGDKLIFASDGVQERLYTQFDRAELARDPDSLAAYLLRHYGKVHDDASCLVFEF